MAEEEVPRLSREEVSRIADLARRLANGDLPIPEPKVVPLSADDIVRLNKEAENQFDSTSIPQVLACRDCKALVLEKDRGMHYFWHLWLDDNTHDHAEDKDLG